jgi:subtilisin family serine protease
MKKIITTLGTLAALAACGGGGSSAEVTPAPTTATADAALAGEIVLMLRTGAVIDDVLLAYGLQRIDQFGQRPIFRTRIAAGTTVDGTLAALRADPRIRFAEPNFEAQAPEARRLEVWAIGGSAQDYGAQWAPQALALAAAHQRSTGAGVRVAVLDTGLELTHPQLAPRIARDGQGRVLGRDFVDGDDDAGEMGSRADAGFGHGTHVAGLVALAAPAATLMPVRVLEPSGRGNLWVLAEALLWAADPDGNPASDDGAHIVNLSVGTDRPTRLLNTAVELATCSDDDDNEEDDDYSDPGFDADRLRCSLQGGVVVMAAAGNGGSASDLHYPAAEAAAGQLAVTATAPDGRLATFANRGAWVQLAAPGAQVISTVPGGGWGTWSGTSMASPLAAGVAALVLAANPDWKPVDVTKRLLDRSTPVCGSSTLRSLHADGAVADYVPAAPACP